MKTAKKVGWGEKWINVLNHFLLSPSYLGFIESEPGPDCSWSTGLGLFLPRKGTDAHGHSRSIYKTHWLCSLVASVQGAWSWSWSWDLRCSSRLTEAASPNSDWPPECLLSSTVYLDPSHCLRRSAAVHRNLLACQLGQSKQPHLQGSSASFRNKTVSICLRIYLVLNFFGLIILTI